jgi:siroheme synthase
MGGRTAAVIKDKLINAGMDIAIPVAVAAALGTKDETTCSATPGTLPIAVESFGFDRLILVGVGVVLAAKPAISLASAAD